MSDVILYLLIALLVLTGIDAYRLGWRQSFKGLLYEMVTTPIKFAGIFIFVLLFFYAVNLVLFDAPSPSLLWNVSLGSCERFTELEIFLAEIYEPRELSTFLRLAKRLNPDCQIMSLN